jgi:hypothetical protein
MSISAKRRELKTGEHDMAHRMIRAVAGALLMSVQADAAQAPADSVDELARDVTRLESLRSVKDLQRSYAQYAQFGLWNEMADLFAGNGRILWGDKEIAGRAAIVAWLQERGGPVGTVPGAMNTLLIDDPLVSLSIDGRSAKGRWRHFGLMGDGKGSTAIEGGMQENHYVLEGGRWKIATLHYWPEFEGNYADGWGNVDGNALPIVPYHFTPDSMGVPVPKPHGRAPRSDVSLATLAARIAAMNAQDDVRNLQHSYGYYVDRKMWDDVVDLFAQDGVIEIAGVGTFRGRDGVRKAMELMGPAGLRHGELNDRPQFGAIVAVSPGAAEAHARGTEVAMLGQANEGKASWEFSVFRNRFVREDGLWKIREMRIQPLLKADYRTGWGKDESGRTSPAPLPAFIGPNPATGKAVNAHGQTVVSVRPLTSAVRASARPAVFGLADLRRRYLRSLAYDGSMNVSAAYGFYLDDAQWDDMSRIFSIKGNKQSPFAGYYIGRDRIAGAATARYGAQPDAKTYRRGMIPYHWRPQPVIIASHDGRSTSLRTRLFQPFTSRIDKASGKPNPNALSSGMYPNDQVVLEDGVWRMWTLTIDEHYFSSPNWQDGWAAAKEPPPGERPPASPLMQRYPPDIAITELGRREEGFRGGTGTTITWPGILPMWFHYRNPVSGRTPERYWPDCVPCEMRPEARLTAHGYQLPPSGPQSDGIAAESGKAAGQP